MLIDKATIIIMTAYEGTVSGKPIKNEEIARVQIDFLTEMEVVESIAQKLADSFSDPARILISAESCEI